MEDNTLELMVSVGEIRSPELLLGSKRNRGALNRRLAGYQFEPTVRRAGGKMREGLKEQCFFP